MSGSLCMAADGTVSWEPAAASTAGPLTSASDLIFESRETALLQTELIVDHISETASTLSPTVFFAARIVAS